MVGARRVLLVVFVIGVLATGCSSGDSGGGGASDTTATGVDRSARLEALIDASGLADPTIIEVPPVDDAATREWLEGEGAPAVALVTATEGLWLAGEGACEETSQRLDEAGSPERLLAAAAGTPDAPTQEILVNLHRFTAEALAACSGESQFDAAAAMLAWHWVLGDRRLTDVGVAR